MDLHMSQPAPDFLESEQLKMAVVRCHLRKIMDISGTDDYFLLKWTPPSECKPEEGAYVL